MENKLRRSRTNRMILGICAGIAKYFKLDATLIRVLFAIGTVVGVGSPILIYLLLFFIMPNEGEA